MKILYKIIGFKKNTQYKRCDITDYLLSITKGPVEKIICRKHQIN
jgi:hypothetical protein